MKIRELRYRSGSAVASAWPPGWGGWGGGRWPTGLEGTAVRVAWAADRKSLRIINRYEGTDYEGSLLVDDADKVLPRGLEVLNRHLPISVEEAGELDLPD